MKIIRVICENDKEAEEVIILLRKRYPKLKHTRSIVGRPTTAFNKAVEIVQDLLKEKRQPADRVIRMVTKEGVSHRTINRVKKYLGISSVKDGRWYWVLPKK